MNEANCYVQQTTTREVKRNEFKVEIKPIQLNSKSATFDLWRRELD